MIVAAGTLGALALLWLALRFPVALLLCVCLAGWLMSEGGPVAPPHAVTERLAPVRERVHAFGADLETRWRCDIATRRAFADGSEEAVAMAERWCPSAGEPLAEGRRTLRSSTRANAPVSSAPTSSGRRPAARR